MTDPSNGPETANRGSGPGDPAFDERRARARMRLNNLVGSASDDPGERLTWFEKVYELAESDAAAVPWADLSPKPVLVDWLARNPGDGKRALDIACGLGDNAEAIAAAGYRTLAFDLAHGAIDWARRRFPESAVDYQVGDLFDPPADWVGGFDLVHEYYTVQALRGDLRRASFSALERLVAPGGILFAVCRSRDDGADFEGPPWPLSPTELSAFDNLGLERVSRRSFVVESGDRTIPHLETVYRKPGT